MAFRVLPGLPPYGPPPTQFTTGPGTHREGVVLEFDGENGAWVANFQRGLTDFDIALEHPDGRSVIIVAGGQGYVVEPRSRHALSFGGDITGAVQASPNRVVFARLTSLEAYGPAGHEWTTRPLSYDGIRSLRVVGDTLIGEGWNANNEKWIEFVVQLATGKATRV